MLRLTSIELQNFKSVKSGSMPLSHLSAKSVFMEGDLTGVYGPQSSGKTALVEAFGILKSVWATGKLPEIVRDVQREREEPARITAEGLVFPDPMEGCTYAFTYKLSIADGRVAAEKLSYRDLHDEKPNLRTAVEYDPEDTAFPVKPRVLWEAALATDGELLNAATEGRAKADATGGSLLYHVEMLAGNAIRQIERRERDEQSTLTKNASKALKDVLDPVWYVGMELRHFARKDFIVDKGGVPDALEVSIRPHHPQEPLLKRIPVNVEGVTEVDRTYLDGLDAALEGINRVLLDLTHDIRIHAERVEDDPHMPDVKVRLVATHSDGYTGPLSGEGAGMRRLVSHVSHLIDMYTYPATCIVSDGFDDGIFEDSLGHLLETVHRYAGGQLIYTGSNFAPLEALPKDVFVFTTLNPSNKYAAFRGSKNTNNLRHQYKRAILNGTQPEPLGHPTAIDDLDEAFYEATNIREGDPLTSDGENAASYDESLYESVCLPSDSDEAI